MTQRATDNQDETLVDSVIETGWTNPPKLSALKQNYDDGLIEHDKQKIKIDAWLENLHITGSAKLKKIKGRSNVQPKTIRKQAEWRYPSLTEPFLSTDDVFNVSPVTANDKQRAYQNQLVLNHQFNTKIGKVKFIDDYVRTAVNEGTVITRVGWHTEEDDVEEEIPVYDYELDTSGNSTKQYMALAALQQTNPDMYRKYMNPGIEKAMEILMTSGQSVIPVQVGTETKVKKIEVKNHPTVEVCDYKNIIVDPTCNGDVSKAQFIIFNFETCLSDLRKNSRYTNLDKINLSGASPLNNPDFEPGADNENFNFEDNPRMKFVASEYWGYWDINGTGITKPFVATWVGGTLIRLEESPFPDKKLPFVFATLMPVKRSAYGEPDGELLIDNQKITGAITRGMIDIMGKSAAGQTGTRRDFLDFVNRKKFTEGRDYEYNGNVDPRMGVYQHAYPEISQSAYNMLNMQTAEAESFTGKRSFGLGISGQALGDVAAGIRGALDAESKRELGLLRRLAEGIIQIGRKFISMNAVMLSDQEVVRVTDEEFVTVNRDDLAGDFDLKLSISTAEEDNQKASELAMMLQTVGPKVDPKITFSLMADIARLRKMPDVAKKLDEYEPQPDPMQVELQKAQLMLLQAQIQKELGLAKEHGASADLEAVRVLTEQANAMLNYAKVGTEKAKAKNLLSTADQADLDFVEQESGVKQERDLQKIGHQAHEQAKTKIIEAKLRDKAKAAN